MASSFFPEVTVNGVTLSSDAIAAEAQNHQAPASQLGQAWQAAARALAIRELLRQEIERQGIVGTPEDLGKGRVETEEEAGIRSLLDRIIEVTPPTEAEIRAHYERAPERYRAPALFESAHILYPAPPEDRRARVEARENAEAALARIRLRPAAFDEIAQTESACPSAKAGGRLGQLVEGDTQPAFEAALARLSPGEIAAEPVETPYGLHIIRLDARAEGAVLPFDRVRSEIAEAMEKVAWARSAKGLVAGLVAAADIEGIALKAG